MSRRTLMAVQHQYGLAITGEASPAVIALGYRAIDPDLLYPPSPEGEVRVPED
jgi:hypothetical protein